jgi:hypothetical protein
MTMSEGRRSTGEISLPPQSASDLSRNTNKVRPSTSLTHLTQAQQDAWNRHQAARAGSNTRAGRSSTNTDSNANAAVLFGGVESLVEESQDWWLKDQSALALGFENWVDGGTDWASLGLGSTFHDESIMGKQMHTPSPVTDSNGAGYPYPAKPGSGYASYNPAPGTGLNGSMVYGHGPEDRIDEEMYF